MKEPLFIKICRLYQLKIDAKIYFAQLYLDNEMNFQPFFLHLDLVCGGYATNYVSLFGFTSNFFILILS